ncbi:hypothetical protein M440DRAFT_1032612 [Trichoderma longibrachiatum ATCC 18648]|uniref:Uncharacterized protein n=1 Tax=Trichoderma longibrachiatum ATCC 18648 TaxID=983965 RepID=A0A2T4BZH2_TRILO|nr:hypothetical protein M440DRAFT_1032612 [Trichoderma longibrachiatum ATCC 18648]
MLVKRKSSQDGLRCVSRSGSRGIEKQHTKMGMSGEGYAWCLRRKRETSREDAQAGRGAGYQKSVLSSTATTACFSIGGKQAGPRVKRRPNDASSPTGKSMAQKTEQWLMLARGSHSIALPTGDGEAGQGRRKRKRVLTMRRIADVVRLGWIIGRCEDITMVYAPASINSRLWEDRKANVPRGQCYRPRCLSSGHPLFSRRSLAPLVVCAGR